MIVLLLELYLLVFIIGLFSFFIAFLFKGVGNIELLWGISLICFSIIMFTSNSVELMTPSYDNESNVYEVTPEYRQYPALLGLGFLFFSLSILGVYVDIFEKYKKTSKGGK